MFPTYRKAHTIYVPDVSVLLYHWATSGGMPTMPFPGHRLFSYGWPLGDEHMARGPELDAVIVDERQLPRPFTMVW